MIASSIRDGSILTKNTKLLGGESITNTTKDDVNFSCSMSSLGTVRSSNSSSCASQNNHQNSFNSIAASSSCSTSQISDHSPRKPQRQKTNDGLKSQASLFLVSAKTPESCRSRVYPPGEQQQQQQLSVTGQQQQGRIQEKQQQCSYYYHDRPFDPLQLQQQSSRLHRINTIKRVIPNQYNQQPLPHKKCSISMRKQKRRKHFRKSKLPIESGVLLLIGLIIILLCGWLRNISLLGTIHRIVVPPLEKYHFTATSVSHHNQRNQKGDKQSPESFKEDNRNVRLAASKTDRRQKEESNVSTEKSHIGKHVNAQLRNIPSSENEAMKNKNRNRSSSSRNPLHVPEFLTIHEYYFHQHSISDHHDDLSSTTTNKATMTNGSIFDSCIVSAFFLLNSKHNITNYISNWMPNFLSLTDDCMIIFCEHDMIELIYNKRMEQLSSQPQQEGSSATKVTFLIEMKLNDLPISQYFYNKSNTTLSNLLIPPTASMDNPNNKNQPTEYDEFATSFWNYQLEIDQEKKLHKQYQVFWIWLSKSWFVVTAGNIIKNYQNGRHNANYDENTNRTKDGNNLILMWADIGMFRNSRFNQRPIVKHPEIVPDQSILWMAHRTPNPPPEVYWNDKLNRSMKQHFYHSGSSAVGYYSTWTKFHKNFVSTMNEYASRDMFIGEDQCILQSTCLRYPNICSYVDGHHVPDNNYFGLRYVLAFGNATTGKYQTETKYLPPFWKPPSTQSSSILTE